MSKSREEVLELLSAKRITTDEADRLLVAIETRNEDPWTWLFNPLERLSTSTALALALVPLAAQLFLEHRGIHFNGALDLHTGSQPNSWGRAALDALVGFPLIAIVFWVGARVGKRGPRFIDVAAAAGLSRWPLTAAGFVLLPVSSQGPEQLQHLAIVPILLVLCSLLLYAWSMAALYRGFRTASGLSGPRLTSTFIGGLVVAELVSKLVLAAPRFL